MKFFLSLTIGVLSSTAALAAGDAAAGLQAMKELNVISLGDVTANSGIEGKIFVGGNFTGSNTIGYGNGNQGLAPSDRPTLTVVGNAKNVGQLHNGSNGGNGPIGTPAAVTVGGSLSGLTLNTQKAEVRVGGAISGVNGSKNSIIEAGGAIDHTNANGATVTSNKGSTFSDPLRASLNTEKTALQENLTALSNALGGLATTAGSGIDYTDRNNVKLTAVAGDGGFAVINTDAASFLGGGIGGLTYDFAPGLTTIVNISGGGVYFWNFNTLSSAAYNPYLIFNFQDAKGLINTTLVRGSILAPSADVINYSAIDGTLVAGSFTQNAQNHLGAFGGDIGFDAPLDTPTVPEASTWAMLIAGFGLIGLSMRRRRTMHVALA